MRKFYYSGPNRTICSALNEIRACFKTHNYAPIKSLVEEVQVMANRMEAALYNQKDIMEMEEYRSQLKKECKELEAKKKELKND